MTCLGALAQDARVLNQRQRSCNSGLERGGRQQLARRVPTRAPKAVYCTAALLPLSSARDGHALAVRRGPVREPEADPTEIFRDLCLRGLPVVHQPESGSRFNPYSLLLFSLNVLRTFSAKICTFSV